MENDSNKLSLNKRVSVVTSVLLLGSVVALTLVLLSDSFSAFRAAFNKTNIQADNYALVSSSTAPKKLFASNFGSGVYLGDLYGYYTNGKGAWQDIKGIDSETGYSWPVTGIPNQNFSGIQWITHEVVTSSTIKDYISTEIREVTGPLGTPVKELFTSVNKKPAIGTGVAQAQFMVKRDHKYGDVNDMYITYWAKHPADLIDKLDPMVSSGNWHAQFEFKTGGYENTGNGDYRIQTTILKDKEGKLYWMSKGDNVANGPWPRVDYWIERNYDVPVPLDKWFKFEVYWHRSAGLDGRYWAAVDGQVLVDHKGPNMGDYSLPINRIFFAPAYSGGHPPVESHVTSLEIWNNFPCGDGVSCYGKGSSIPTDPTSTTTEPNPTPTPIVYPTPTLNLNATPTTIDFKSSSNLSWSTTNADSCTASGDWSGTKAINSSESTGSLSSNKSYALTCKGAGGTVTKSVAVMVNPDTVPPSTPTNLSTSNITTNSATLTWSPATDNDAIASYNIYRNNTKIANVLSTSFNDSVLTPATNYSYSVSAVDKVGNESVKSGNVSITTLSDSLKINSVVLSSKNNNSATVNVTLNKSAKVYLNYGTSTTAMTMKTQSPVDKLDHKLSLFNLLPNTTYYYKVTAIGANNNQVSYEVSSFKTLIAVGAGQGAVGGQ